MGRVRRMVTRVNPNPPRFAPVLQDHDDGLPPGPPQELGHAELHGGGVHGEHQQQHAGADGPVVVVDPPADP